LHFLKILAGFFPAPTGPESLPDGFAQVPEGLADFFPGLAFGGCLVLIYSLEILFAYTYLAIV
jgi:hypothetical protein